MVVSEVSVKEGEFPKSFRQKMIVSAVQAGSKIWGFKALTKRYAGSLLRVSAVFFRPALSRADF
jgi:hypothetical protein